MTRPVPLLALAAAVAVAACAPKPSSVSTCASGQEWCKGLCVDRATYASDTANCGGCGIACAAGASCTSGACACPAGQEVCGHACVDPATYASDPANCGGCGIACGVGTCAGGVCDCGAFTSCPLQTPRCVDGLTDPDHCGIGAAACDTACTVAGETCDAGTCACPSGTTGCPVAAPTACVSLQTDAANCGGCGTRCATGATCASGACQCPAGESVCDGACVNRSTDGTNCGACGWTCPAGATCGGGSCACPSGQTTICGPGASGGGTCCAGDACCSSACQTEHTNGTGVTGLGQHYYDCLPLGTYDIGQAQQAASAWQASGQPVYGIELGCVSQSCFGWRTQTSCGVWCYGGTADPLRGRASLIQSLVCACPASGTPNWN